MSLVYFNHRFIHESEARISAGDRGFRFGDGVFETIAIHSGVPYQWELHEKRLNDGLRICRIDADISPLSAALKQLIAYNGLKEKHGRARISISRGVGSMGYLPSPKAIPTILIETFPEREMDITPKVLWADCSYRKPPKESMPVEVKTAQGLNSTLARLEARDNDCFDSILLHMDGTIAECSSGHMFWLKDGTLYTPSPEGILRGTTRDALLRLSPYTVKQGKYPLDALKDADEVGILNVAWVVLAVKAILPQNYCYTQHAACKKLRDILLSDRERYAAKKNASA